MIERTTEQIEEKFKEVWSETTPEIAVLTNEKDLVRVSVTQMYEPPGYAFSYLKELSDFFDTTDISDEERISNSGCDTCDYGSCYGFIIRIRKKEVK